MIALSYIIIYEVYMKDKEDKVSKGMLAQLDRLTYINSQIANHKFPNCKKLSQEVGVSEITVRRDIKILREEYQAPIVFDTYENGFYYDDDEYEFPLSKNLKENELQLLGEAKVLLSHFKDTPIYKGLEDVLESFCTRRTYKADEDFLLRRIALAPNPYPKISVNEAVWDHITMALRGNYILRFKYPAPSADITEPPLEKSEIPLEDWTVHPYQLVLDRGICYLFGFAKERNAVRLFDLSKISHLLMSAQKFNLPSDFEFEKHTGGGNFGAFTRYKPKRYKIAFYEAARPLVRSGKWAEDQIIEEDEENHRTIITFTASQDMRILDWIFENKAYVLPLEPQSLVDRWKYNVGVMAQMAGYDVDVNVDIEEVNKREREE